MLTDLGNLLFYTIPTNGRQFYMLTNSALSYTEVVYNLLSA